MTKRPMSAVLLVACLAAAAPTTKPSSSPPPPPDFLVTGTVTDDAGRPVAGAVVIARCGTDDYLIRTGTARTDKAGHYRLPFEPGVHYERSLGQPVVGFQTATIAVYKGGYFEKNLGRQGGLAMSDDPPALRQSESHDYAGVVRVHQPYTLDFVLAKAATVEGTLLDPAGQPVPDTYLSLTGDQLPPSSTVLASAKTDDAGHFRFNNVPTGYAWSFQNRDRGYDENNLSPTFTLASPEKATFTVTADATKHTLTFTPADAAQTTPPAAAPAAAQ